MPEGFILCYREKGELKRTYDSLQKVRNINSPLFDLSLYMNEKDMPYPFTLVVEYNRKYGSFDELDEVLSKLDLGRPDMYLLRGREFDIRIMTPLRYEEL